MTTPVQVVKVHRPVGYHDRIWCTGCEWREDGPDDDGEGWAAHLVKLLGQVELEQARADGAPG